MTLIAKNIRWFRKQQQISQTEFASIFGITRASVGAYEEGRAEPKLELISRFAKYYNIDLNSFIDKDMSQLNGITNEELRQTDTVGNTTKPKAKSSFVPEILETSNTIKTINSAIEHTQRNTDKVSKSKNNNIVFYKSVNDFISLNKSQWPFFSGCDAVFECTPHLERSSTRFRDGVYFLCTKINQEGTYNGIFIEQDRMRLNLIEGELDLIDTSREIWRVLYTVDSINSILL